MKKLDINNLGAVFFDIDGTTVTSDGEVLPSTRKVVEILKTRNIPVCLASGRASFGAQKIIDELNIIDPCMFHSGGVILDPKTSDPYVTHEISKNTCLDMLSFCERKNLYLELYTLTDYYTQIENELTDIHTEVLKKDPIIKNLSDVIESEPIIKTVIITTSDKEYADVLSYKKEKQHDLYFGIAPGSRFTHVCFANITSHQASREAAFEWFSKKYSLSERDSFSFGDAESDIPFFKRTTVGVCMSNAKEEIQREASYITSSNNEDGVYRAFKHFYPEVF